MMGSGLDGITLRRAAVRLLLATALVSACSPPFVEREPDGPRVGPPRGFLVVAGGGRLGDDVFRRFVQLAGGPDAPIVVIPTAGAEDTFPDGWSGLDELRAAGARNLRILHTRDRARADSGSFVRALDNARGVWIPGGRQWRLVDAYLGTRTERALHRLLERGGVVGGSSAGASIQASFLVRGAPETNQIVVAPGYTRGFGFLRGVAVDQHLLARHREDDLFEVLAEQPQLLGIGIDEGTAIVVQGDRFEVIGRSKVAIYSMEDDAGPSRPVRRYLAPGDRYDMGRRRPLPRAP